MQKTWRRNELKGATVKTISQLIEREHNKEWKDAIERTTSARVTVHALQKNRDGGR